jgi:hypothetical protein
MLIAKSEGSREMKSDAFETPALARHARKGVVEEEPTVGSGSRRMTVRMCSRAAESSRQVVGTISNEIGGYEDYLMEGSKMDRRTIQERKQKYWPLMNVRKDQRWIEGLSNERDVK